jgi:tetratricopeptide (TPR) repeat protein
MNEYSKALPYFEKSLEIKQQTLPQNHPSLASTYDNIGTLHENMKNYSKARSCFERAIDIGQHSLPSGHPNIQRWKKNLERVKKL